MNEKLQCQFNMESIAFANGERLNVLGEAIMRVLNLDPQTPEITEILQKAIDQAKKVPRLKDLYTKITNDETTVEDKIETAKRIASGIYLGAHKSTVTLGGNTYEVTKFKIGKDGRIIPIATLIGEADTPNDKTLLAMVMTTSDDTQEGRAAIRKLYKHRHSNLKLGTIIEDQAQRFYMVNEYEFSRVTGEFKIYGYLQTSPGNDLIDPKFSTKLSQIEWARPV